MDLRNAGAVTEPIEGPPECLAPSAASLIKQLAKGTKLSTLTARDRKAKNPWRNETFFLIRSLYAHHTHKNAQIYPSIPPPLFAIHVWQLPAGHTESGGHCEKRGEKMGEDSISVLHFYDFLNVLERLAVEPNCSPSCVFESEVLTGASLASKAARHSHSRGMRVLLDAVKEEESGKRVFFTLKLRKSPLPGRRAVLLGSYLGVTKESSLPNAWQKTKR